MTTDTALLPTSNPKLFETSTTWPSRYRIALICTIAFLILGVVAIVTGIASISRISNANETILISVGMFSLFVAGIIYRCQVFHSGGSTGGYQRLRSTSLSGSLKYIPTPNLLQGLNQPS